jgi:hypothetical protein
MFKAAEEAPGYWGANVTSMVQDAPGYSSLPQFHWALKALAGPPSIQKPSRIKALLPVLVRLTDKGEPDAPAATLGKERVPGCKEPDAMTDSCAKYVKTP